MDSLFIVFSCHSLAVCLSVPTRHRVATTGSNAVRPGTVCALTAVERAPPVAHTHRSGVGTSARPRLRLWTRWKRSCSTPSEALPGAWAMERRLSSSLLELSKPPAAAPPDTESAGGRCTKANSSCVGWRSSRRRRHRPSVPAYISLYPPVLAGCLKGYRFLLCLCWSRSLSLFLLMVS